jgi:ribosomal protein S18 acetylase RimI-like enzyme
VSEKPKGARRRAKAAPLSIEIRVMQLRDVPAVYDLGERLFTAEQLPTLYRSWDDHELMLLFNTDNDTCLVAAIDEKVVGFALGRIMEKPGSAWRYGWLLWLGVDPHYKRLGIAGRLLNQLTTRFVDSEARIMLVDTDEDNHDAINFFRKKGFGQEIRHVYLSMNLDDHPRALERRYAREEEP